MRYGFVIDQDRCIGCHACTVACKEEHQVPVGVFRTWVKYIEKGEFPHTRRHFGVMRCNHCDSAPCIEICPTHALFRRSDGIVDFDHRRCIGCKSCMQACPYDALYIDPNTNTAAKCNFCAHRVEANLEPACVIVCPTQAIIAGDLDNPGSTASRIVATERVSVRKPHKGTAPKLFYKGIESDLLEPTRLARQNTYVFADRHDDRPTERSFDAALTREVYDVAHPAAWGWKIAAYLWTKSIAAGVMLLAALSIVLASASVPRLVHVTVPAVALFFLAATLALLVLDLKRPGRFWYLLTRPNFRSWLTLGGYVLMLYGIALSAWLLTGVYGHAVPKFLVWSTGILALASAAYSALLFAQAKGRDFWQSKLFFLHLLVQALVAGSATAVLMDFWLGAADWSELSFYLVAAIALAFSPAVNLLLLLLEAFLPRRSPDSRLAARNMARTRFKTQFWILVVGLGCVVPSLLLVVSVVFDIDKLIPVVAFTMLAGLWFQEDLWVKAGQSVPLS
jgi:Fe-S-cluster-containing dehydrogenase component/formate-dependent nitrite reductase membrane component NrfD